MWVEKAGSNSVCEVPHCFIILAACHSYLLQSFQRYTIIALVSGFSFDRTISLKFSCDGILCIVLIVTPMWDWR